MEKFCGRCGSKLVDDKCPKCDVKVEKNVDTSKTNGLAVAGFVLSIISLCCCGVTSIFGLIFSIIGLVDCNNKNQEGKGLAIAGIIISGIFILLSIIICVIVYSAGLYETLSSY